MERPVGCRAAHLAGGDRALKVEEGERVPNRHRRAGSRSALRGLDVEQHLQDPRIKQRYVTAVFDLAAPRYDRFTRVLSFGMDRKWKRELLGWLATLLPPGCIVLDVACGTGDLALGAARLGQGYRVLGMDLSFPMIGAAQSQLQSQGVALSVGDMMRLAIRQGSVDAATIGYGLRNAPDLGLALEEIVRVLKPGGRLFILDFYRPEHPLWRPLFLWYLWLVGWALGWLWHREPAVYGYIARSIDHYVSSVQFSSALRERGLAVEYVGCKLFGGLCIHVARTTQ